MALLEPQLRLSTVVRIIILAGIFSAGLYFLFWHVFYVVFPDGLVWSLW
jgi:amino acid transporter